MLNVEPLGKSVCYWCGCYTGIRLAAGITRFPMTMRSKVRLNRGLVSFVYLILSITCADLSPPSTTQHLNCSRFQCTVGINCCYCSHDHEHSERRPTRCLCLPSERASRNCGTEQGLGNAAFVVCASRG